jgi:hypothetical protein
MDLPVYNPAPEAAAELPAYTGRRSTSTPAVHQQPPAEYVFELRNKSTPWATLNIKGCAGYTGELPTFFEGKNITGSVGLNLENGENIHSIVASVSSSLVRS